jgi:DNA-binding IclR family transcriptional regulator
MSVSKIAMVLEVLGDGKWHGITELLMTLELNEQKFREIAAFLNKYDFVKVDEKNRRVKINRDFQKLLAQPVT